MPRARSGHEPLMTATTPEHLGDEPPTVDPGVGKYYRQMAEGWGAHLTKGWRAWVGRLAFWRSRP